MPGLLHGTTGYLYVLVQKRLPCILAAYLLSALVFRICTDCYTILPL